MKREDWRERAGGREEEVVVEEGMRSRASVT